MRTALARIFLCLSAFLSVHAADPYNVTDPYMAEYEGFWGDGKDARGRLTAQIRPLSKNRYDGFVLFNRVKSPVAAVTLNPATEANGRVTFTGATPREPGGDLLGQAEITCELHNGKMTGTFKGDFGEGTFEAARHERKAPSLGAKPPKHAIILTGEGSSNAWQNLTWPSSAEGVLRSGRGNIRAREKLQNFRLHLEFRTPYLPIEEGQARGNSGVYLQGKYEVQVLDSFGLYPLRDNDCGGIYQVKSPLGNACFPPMQWQTYDITYVDGTPTKPPRITVEHNGIKVIDRIEIPANLIATGTGGADLQAGFLMLQDHGNPVEFRNIWALPFFSAERTR